MHVERIRWHIAFGIKVALEILAARHVINQFETADLDNAVRQNVRRVVSQLRNQTDPLMQEPLAEGRLKVVGAYYDLDTGAVDFFDRG